MMMRGINHQNIFEDAEDYYQFMTTLDRVRVQYDDLGLPCGTSCTIYAYCLMANHFHLLIREREETVGETVKRIRLNKASTLLRNGNMKVEKVAEAAGYQNVEHFNRLFKKKYGMTPVQYRSSR